MSSPTENRGGSTSSNKNIPVPMPKLKVLAFHGYRQNGNSFKGKIGSFRKAVSKYVDITFLTGPHTVKPEEGDDINEEQRGWWFNAEDHTFSGKRVGGPAIGFTDSLQLIEKTFREHGPFHGVLGFSQGACLVGILTAMQQKGLLPYKFNFAILASGFCSGSLVHKSFYDADVTLPTMHIYGETDKVIPKEMSETLANVFVKPMVVEHHGGHYFACSGSLKNSYKDFFEYMLDECLNPANESDEEEFHD